MLLTKTVKLNWSNTIKRWYEDKGYVWTKNNDEFEVKVEDLYPNSSSRISYLCDYCLKEGVENIITVSWRSYNAHKNGTTRKDACPNHINKKLNEIGIKRNHKRTRYTKDEIKEMYLELMQKIKTEPKTKHIVQEHKINPVFPSIGEVRNEFGDISSLKTYCNVSTKRITYTKVELLTLLKTYIDKNGLPTSKKKTFCSKNNLPSYLVYAKEFGDDLVCIVELCGVSLTDEEKYQINNRGRKLTLIKEEAIKKIYDMQSKINRPLMYDDFRCPKADEVGITLIKQYWGTMNKMKEELGLEIIQEDMVSKSVDGETIKQNLIKICSDIFKLQGRKVITCKDIDNAKLGIKHGTYIKILKQEYGMTIRGFLKSIGFDLQKEGNGLNYVFDDGEKVKSQHELNFSNYLRDKLGLRYKTDYFREIKYRIFIKEYSGLMNCDYIINFNNKTIYIEIAGIIRSMDNSTVSEANSKSKIKYKQKLLEKEKMLKENNLEYYILFPSDCSEEFFNAIFNDYENR